MPEHDEIGFDRTVRRRHRAGFEALDPDPAPDVDPVRAHGVGDALAEVGVDDAERLWRSLDDRRRAPPLDVGLGHLQADVAATDDDDPAAPGLGQGEQRLGVVERSARRG